MGSAWRVRTCTVAFISVAALTGRAVLKAWPTSASFPSRLSTASSEYRHPTSCGHPVFVQADKFQRLSDHALVT
jgi:hypothetical protein